MYKRNTYVVRVSYVRDLWGLFASVAAIWVWEQRPQKLQSFAIWTFESISTACDERNLPFMQYFKLC